MDPPPRPGVAGGGTSRELQPLEAHPGRRDGRRRHRDAPAQVRKRFALPAQPRHLGGRERLDGVVVSARAGGVAQFADIDTIQTYRGQALGNLDPHIFAVAEEAYTQLEREQRDQSVIVSGESGAGKTVSAKYAMRYFATVGGSVVETQVEKKVLASSPIMEAIGNAKTTRNDNSSRFGKFIELQFNKQFHIVGASMRTYLLEKSRVVFQTTEERNYHIFYQLCAARKKLPQLFLDHQDHFHYLNQGGSPDVNGVDDAETFEETVNALNLLGFSEKEQIDMFKVFASVLHLGNIRYLEGIIESENEQDQEGCLIEPEDKHMKILCDLLEIDQDDMRQWLCTRKLVSMREVFLKPMTLEEATISRDALAKHIYAELFNWIVLVINRSLESDTPRHRFIGVLDIYGFETFETNSFEQFCINYANEKLQQQFNLHVFKLEQEEYIREGIGWKMIEFYDNQPCIDLIETKLGILDLLDEECKMPRGSDASWTEKLYTKCSKYPHFSKGRFGASSFVVNHFADKVQYESTGFLEKNRDTVIEEQINVIKASRNGLVKRLFASESQKLAAPGVKVKVVASKPVSVAHKTHKKSVCSQFRDSLNMLMSTLNATTPHYVRCIKPNDSKTPFEYNAKRAVQQLRACGVLETIRLSSAGFPSRWTYVDFFYRYRVLCKFKDIRKDDMRKTCENIIGLCIKTSDVYQFGKTKIFFRAGQVAYLEKLRSDKLRLCCIMMQKTVRMFVARKKYLKIKRSALLIQTYGRGVLARRLAESLRRERAAKTIQRYVRGWVKMVQFQRLRRCVIGLQRYSRGYMARLRFIQLKYNAAAVQIQRHVRGWLARKEVKKRRRQIVLCQSAIRRYLARKQYKRLRIEARSIEHVKTLNKGLENKIISLQQRIDEVNKTNHELRNYQSEVQELKSKMQTFRAMEIEIKNLNNLLIDKNKAMAKLEEQLQAERDDKMDVVHEFDRYRAEAQAQRDGWDGEMAKLRAELQNINEIVRVNEKGAEENLKVRIEEEKLMLQSEADSDREAYQRLLRDHHALEQQYEDLKAQVALGGHGAHRRNISDISSISAVDEQLLNSDLPEDHGYGMTSDSNARNDTTEPKMDVSLVLKLQHRLSGVEREKTRMQKRLDEIDLSPKSDTQRSDVENAARLSEMELCNSQLKTQLFELQNSINEGTGPTKLHEQLKELQTELERKSEEIVQLKSVLANQTNNIKSILNSKTRTGTVPPDISRFSIILHELCFLFHAYRRTLTLPLQMEISKLLEDNERQQRILSANLTTPQTQGEAYMQMEITRLTTENLELHDKIDLLNETVRKLKKQRKVYLKPRTAVALLPGLPAYIIFMCIRHTDYINDEDKVRCLLSTFTNTLKKVMRKRQDFETTTLWLSNTLRLIHNLKQYSGEEAFQRKNTPKQNEQCLKNFDLSEYRQIFSDTAVWIYQSAHLLQARKTDEDVESVCEMCDALTPLQICKVLNLYTPVDEFEQRVPASFIRAVQERLKGRPDAQAQQALLMDVKYKFPVRFPFNPSVICLEDIDIPESLGLPMLEKL
ncbi:unnamed protein product [Phaedon cochleariae]|uniref:Uncharacterized protein n=1 Tax=Phaedon cochleariae TaxID=80249 RepID=A0A9N9SFE4_PHACE|nr:unnamed protein product [Phaedon cochleariae]